MKAPVLPLACLATGIVCFVAGRQLAPSADSETTAPSTAQTVADRLANARLSQRDTSTADERLERAERNAADTGDRITDIFLLVDAVDRNQQLMDLLDQTTTSEQFQDLVASFRAMGITQQHMGEYELMLSAWAQVDPLAALTYASDETRGPFARQTLLKAWAGYDPDSALSWALSNHNDPDQANPWLVGVIEGVAATDVQRATDLTGTLPRSRERGDALDALVQRVTQLDATTALEWTQAFSDDEALQRAAVARIAERTAATDIDATISYLATIENPDVRRAALDNVTEQWSQTDASAAVAYTESLPDAERGQALRGLMRTLGNDDPERAADLLWANNGIDDLDGARTSFAWASHNERPELAAEFVPLVQNGRQRNRLYRNVYREWSERDPAAARQWIESQENIPDNLRERLLN